MKGTGITRGVDALGRIVLPKELRNQLGIDTDSKLEIFIEGEHIVLKKYNPAGACEFCGEVEPATQSIQLKGKCICSACQAKLKMLMAD